MLLLVTKSNSFFQWLVTWNGGASICAADRRKWLLGPAELPWSLYIRQDSFSVEIQVRAVLVLGLQLWLLAAMGCQGYGCGLFAAGLERQFQRGASVSAWKVGSMLKLSISVELAKKESAWGFNPISVSAWNFSFSKETKRESFSVEPCTVSAWR